ncbi:MAG: HAD hydrolase-like protein [Chromatiales bacterium]|nr:HAD hydrolase-like protein [Chromatiales bacterium]
MTAEDNKLLVLDGQGVVFDAPIKRFLATFADDQQLSLRDIEARWESGLRERAWRGRIDDANLWNELAGRSVDAAQTRLRLDASYRPGPAAPYLADWSGKARLCLLSNHRSAWLLPQLDAFGIRSFFEKIWVSDATGHVKPEAAAFDPVFRYRDAGLHVLFVDDQPHNVRAAEALGIRGLVANPDQSWLEQVSRWLNSVPQRATPR